MEGAEAGRTLKGRERRETMSEAMMGMIAAFGRTVAAVAGKKVKDQVMAGSEKLTAGTKGSDVARWMKGAVERLDRLTDKKAGVDIMERCGVNCARHNSRVLKGAIARRKKHSSLDAFLEAEVKKPMTGTKLERRGSTLMLTYLPQTFSKSMRCFCAQLKDLPDKEEISPTYCHCSKAFVGAWWEAVLGKPVKVKILETALTGSRQCTFKIEMGS
jgi:predicted hydrocarbon binding protein